MITPRLIPIAPLEVRHPEVCAFLRDYSGQSTFLHSLRGQFLTYGNLSPKQIECVERELARETVTVSEAIATVASTYSQGDVLVVGKWMARKVAENAGYTDHKAHHAIEVLESLRESPKAVQVTVKLSAQRTNHCGICGLGLTDPVSVDAGIGPVCAENLGIPHDRTALDALREKLTVTHPFTTWIPKSQIKEHRKAV